jgi:SAM-dependent methyltransferase
MVDPSDSEPELGGDAYKLSSRRTFDRWGASYDRNIFVRLFAGTWDAAILARLKPLVPPSRILDLGCATGRLLGKLSAFPGMRLAGADLSRGGLEIAERKLASVGCKANLRLCDIEQELPWEEASFDAVVSSGVMHHLPDPARAFAQALRVLKPGGVFLVSDPYFPTPLRQVANLVLRIRPVHGDCHFHHPAEAVRMLRQQGFAEASWRRVSWHSFLAIAQKPGTPRMG